MRTSLGSALEYLERDLEASIGFVTVTSTSTPVTTMDTSINSSIITVAPANSPSHSSNMTLLSRSAGPSSPPSQNVSSPAAREDCVCAEVWEPICGSDGQEYSSPCHAWCAGLTSWTPGTCGSSGVGGNEGGFESAETSESNPRSWGLDRIDQVSWCVRYCRTSTMCADEVLFGCR